MLLRIPVARLRLGMYIDKLDGPWLNHPFWRMRFRLDRAEDLKRLQVSAVETVWIDLEKGQPGLPIGQRGTPATAPPTPAAKPPGDLPAAPPCDELRMAWRLRAQAVQVITRVFDDARLGNVVDLQPCKLLVNDVMASVDRDSGALLSLCRLKTFDEYTYLHSLSVCALMAALSLRMGLSIDESQAAALAGLLHDVGKARVRASVLNKPGALTPAEFEVVGRHPAMGHEILLQAGVTDPRALDVCLHHHEKMSGAGYPHGLSAPDISLFARMGAVCDVYDAVTSDRPYKQGWDPALALTRMAAWDQHLDPAIVGALVQTVGIYPTGSLVQMISGRVGVVLENHPAEWTQPLVRLFHSTRSGMPIPVHDVDLAATGCKERIDAASAVEGTYFPQAHELWSNYLRSRARSPA